MTQNTTVPGHPEPGPDTFSFEDYLEGVSTFPTFEHTAYLDQKSGSEYAQILEEMDLLIEEQDVLDKRIATRTQQTSNSFVDATLDSMLEDRERVEGRLRELNSVAQELSEKIKSSGITLTFQVKTPEELGSITREATRQFHKENTKFKNASDDDLDYVTARSRYMLTAQIAHFCTRVTLPGGRVVPPPTRQAAELLLSKLISSEMMRLMESVGTGLSASQDWANKLDAGFPGRSADVEDVSLDQDGPEDGEVVGAAAAHDVDREALGVERRAEPEARHGDDDSGRGDM